MYKKVTHEIVEHHFDHPTGVDCYKSMQATGISPDGILPIAVINERTMLFRMDSRTLWTRYALGMINYSVSVLGNLGNTENIKNNLSRNSNNVGSYFIPYYGYTAGTRIGEFLIALGVNGTKVVDIVKADKTDIKVYTEIWAKQSRALADYFNELNPNYYPTDLLTEMFTNLTNFWAEDFFARYNKDFAADAVALDNILKIGVSGIPDHSKQGYSSIADILSRGIIAQFPLSFIE